MRYFPLLIKTFACVAFLMLGLPANAQDQDANPSRRCPIDIWARYTLLGEQEFELIEQIQHPKGLILVFRLSPLIGKYAKTYVFLQEEGECFSRIFSVGSYSWYDTGEDPRTFHADLYDTSSHSTIGFFKGPPDYETVRKLALKTLK